MKRTIVTLDEETGEVEVDANGYKKGACLKDLAFLEDALGPAKKEMKDDKRREAKVVLTE